ncbi:uncharacterized protein LOC144019105 [Festucalex cinctus]
MLTPEKSGAQPSTSAQMTFHRTMTTTMGPMQDSLGQSSKEREDHAHSNVRPLVLRQRKLLLIGPKVTLLTVSRTKNVHQPIHPRKKGPRDAAAELNSHLPADILELFITDELLQHIVHHTNLYANQSMQKQTAKSCILPRTIPKPKSVVDSPAP